MAKYLPDMLTIEKYLNGELAEEEGLSLESAIEQDEEVAQAVQGHLKSMALAKEMGKALWKQEKKQEFVDTLEGPLHGKRRIFLFRLAAVFLILILASGLWKWATQNPLSPDLWMTENLKIPVAPELMSTQQNKELARAYTFYNQAAYEQAEHIFSSIDPAFPGANKSEISFFTGMNLFQLGKYSAARHAFSEASSLAYQEMSAWYTAVSWVKEGDYVQAKQALRAILETENHFRSEARELLKTLDQGE